MPCRIVLAKDKTNFVYRGQNKFYILLPDLCVVVVFINCWLFLSVTFQEYISVSWSYNSIWSSNQICPKSYECDTDILSKLKYLIDRFFVPLYKMVATLFFLFRYENENIIEEINQNNRPINILYAWETNLCSLKLMLII